MMSAEQGVIHREVGSIFGVSHVKEKNQKRAYNRSDKFGKTLHFGTFIV